MGFICPSARVWTQSLLRWNVASSSIFMWPSLTFTFLYSFCSSAIEYAQAWFFHQDFPSSRLCGKGSDLQQAQHRYTLNSYTANSQSGSWILLVHLESSGNNLQFRHFADALNTEQITVSNGNTKYKYKEICWCTSSGSSSIKQYGALEFGRDCWKLIAHHRVAHYELCRSAIFEKSWNWTQILNIYLQSEHFNSNLCSWGAEVPGTTYCQMWVGGQKHVIFGSLTWNIEHPLT